MSLGTIIRLAVLALLVTFLVTPQSFAWAFAPKRAQTVMGESKWITFTWPDMKASINCAQLRSRIGLSAFTPSCAKKSFAWATSSGAESVIGR